MCPRRGADLPAVPRCPEPGCGGTRRHECSVDAAPSRDVCGYRGRGAWLDRPRSPLAGLKLSDLPGERVERRGRKKGGAG